MSRSSCSDAYRLQELSKILNELRGLHRRANDVHAFPVVKEIEAAIEATIARRDYIRSFEVAA